MPKFRKKPVVIEAIQHTPENRVELANFLKRDILTEVLVIDTLEGEMVANIGDWIIKGVKGEFYPCKPDIFELTYEPVEESKGFIPLSPWSPCEEGCTHSSHKNTLKNGRITKNT